MHADKSGSLPINCSSIANLPIPCTYPVAISQLPLTCAHIWLWVHIQLTLISSAQKSHSLLLTLLNTRHSSRNPERSVTSLEDPSTLFFLLITPAISPVSQYHPYCPSRAQHRKDEICSATSGTLSDFEFHPRRSSSIGDPFCHGYGLCPYVQKQPPTFQATAQSSFQPARIHITPVTLTALLASRVS